MATEYNLGNVKGPPGDIGPTGKTGPQGGQGPAGTAATVNVGVVTTGQPGTPAAVENAGTENAAVLNFTIPKGEKGEPGAAGATGATGAAGPTGPQGPAGKDGKSAYQSAAEGGYTGTEAQLNAALAEVPGHVGDTVKHVTAAERAAWDGKETPAGAQAKADAAEANAKAASRPNTWLPTTADIGAETPAGAQAKADEAAALKASTATYTATLTTTWSGSGPYTQTVNVAGMLATDNPVADVVLSDVAATAQAQLEAWGLVGRITTANGSITATCYDEKPGTALTVQFKVVR